MEYRPEPYPRVSGLGIALGAGAGWGLFGYTVLWEGVPFTVQRPFVVSALGTFVLLPTRIVLWAIHLAETIAGHSFDLSTNHAWIAPTAALVGSAIVVATFVAARATVRRSRGPRVADR